MSAVLVLGAYGNFGKRIVELLARQNIGVVAAGRNQARLDNLKSRLDRTGRISSICFDLQPGELARQLERLQPAAVINTCGPFQGQDYSIARVCIERRVPYIDLADGRDYVADFASLDGSARQLETVAISGASTVPALTSAVLDHYWARFAEIDFLDFGIAPGQKTERGLATTKAILGYVGRPLKACAGYPERHGWQDVHAEHYPGIGKRWMANCEVPDLDLLPERYGIKRIRFSAGMELGLVHFGLWSLSWLVRWGLPLQLSAFAAPLLRVSNLLDGFGSSDGGMHVVVAGLDPNGQPAKLAWHIVALKGHGPYIPAVPAVVLAKRILAGQMRLKGAFACVGLIGLNEYLAELGHLDVKAYERFTSDGGQA